MNTHLGGGSDVGNWVAHVLFKSSHHLDAKIPSMLTISATASDIVFFAYYGVSEIRLPFSCVSLSSEMNIQPLSGPKPIGRLGIGRPSAFAFSAFAVFAIANSATAAITISGYTAQTNDRFTNSASLITDGFNLSGIGQASNGLWATAISNNVIVSANHAKPSGTVYFYPGNDPSQTPITRTITSGMRVGNSDLYVGVLDQPLPTSIAFYSFANQLLAAPPSAGTYQNQVAYVFGRAPVDETTAGDNRFPYNDQAIGRNRIDGYLENVSFLSLSDVDALIMFYDTPGVPYETLVQSGDSGAPVFVDIGGEFRLVGTNAFQFTDRAGNRGSGVNYIGNQAVAINDYILANAVAVPEPRSILMAIAGIGFVCLRRLRN